MAARASSEFVHRSARRGLDGRQTAPSGARGPCRSPGGRAARGSALRGGKPHVIVSPVGGSGRT